MALFWNHEKLLWRGFGAHLAGLMDRPDAPDAHFSKEIATLLIKAFTQRMSVYFERCCGLGLQYIPQAWYTCLMLQMCIFPRKPQRYLKSVVISIETRQAPSQQFSPPRTNCRGFSLDGNGARSAPPPARPSRNQLAVVPQPAACFRFIPCLKILKIRGPI